MSQIKIEQIDLEYYDIDERVDRKHQKKEKKRKQRKVYRDKKRKEK